jgi:hypothetical protein
MKDVIKEILEANEKAKNDIENVEKLKLESAHRVRDKLSEIQSEYIDKARMNIKVIQKIEESKAEMKIEKINEECEKNSEKIEKIYSKNKNSWINSIFDNIVGRL